MLLYISWKLKEQLMIYSPIYTLISESWYMLFYICPDTAIDWWLDFKRWKWSSVTLSVWNHTLPLFLKVNLVSEHIWCDDFLVRSFYLKNVQTNETRTVTQFHFLSWMDQNVPESARTLLDFRRYVSFCSISPSWNCQKVSLYVVLALWTSFCLLTFLMLTICWFNLLSWG